MSLELPNEPTIMDARLAFSDAQAALAGGTSGAIVGPTRSAPWPCGWYGTAISGDRGAFALVDRDSPLNPLVIGDRLKLTYASRSVLVYCVGATDLDHDIHITRRAFAALTFLAVESIGVSIEVVSG